MSSAPRGELAELAELVAAADEGGCAAAGGGCAAGGSSSSSSSPPKPTRPVQLSVGRTAILIARHGERLDDAEAAKGRLWVPSAVRPWDPPLTETGRAQASALGQAAARHAERLGLRPLSRVFASPYLRCVETAVEAAHAAGATSVCVEPSLGESMCEFFYRSWCVPRADSSWGGPRTCRIGTPVPDSELHPAALHPAGQLLRPERLHELRSSVVLAVDQGYRPFLRLDELEYRWGNFEDDEGLGARLRRFYDFVADTYPGETIMLVSHGGPVKSLFQSLKPATAPRLMVGYCGLYILHRESGEDGEWEAPVVADMQHMQRWVRILGSAYGPSGQGAPPGRAHPPGPRGGHVALGNPLLPSLRSLRQMSSRPAGFGHLAGQPRPFGR